MPTPPPAVRSYRAGDFGEWLRLRLALWPDLAEDGSPEGSARAWLSRKDAAVLVVEQPDGSGLAGFAEVGRRDFADGCETGPVAYLEAWYVEPNRRGQGVGAALIRAAEAWAGSQGYQELASDALLENQPSQWAHRAVGFVEVERSVKYRKRLSVSTVSD